MKCRGGVIEPKHLPPNLRENDFSDVLHRAKGVTLAAMEKVLIADALRRNDGNRRKRRKNWELFQVLFSEKSRP